MKTRVLACFLLAIILLPTTARAVPRESVEVPIIMYHKVTKDGSQLGKFAITPAALEEDLQFLRSKGYQAVTMQALIAFVHGAGKLPEKPIVLTFDDGYFSDYHYVYPLARQYKMPIVSSIIGKVTDDYTAEGRTDILYPHLTWPQVEEMARSGLVEFQNHGYDIHCTRCGTSGAKRRSGESRAHYAARLEEDLTKFQARFEEHIGTAPAIFTYPFGAKSEGSDEVLKSLGFMGTLAVEGKRNMVTKGDADCLFSMGRILRPHRQGLEQLLASAP